MVGRKPKPLALKVLDGNPGKKRLPTRQPKPRPVTPDPPSWLGDAAKACWKRVVPELERLNLLTIVDGDALATYCVAWEEFEHCSRTINELGFVYEARQGSIPRPEVTIRHKAMQLMRAFATEFGLTPSSRGRLVVPSNSAGGEIDDLLD